MPSTIGKRLRVGVIAAAIAATSVACASTDAASTEDGTTSEECSNVRISATSVDSLPYFAILQTDLVKGWFSEAGLEVSFFSGAGGGNTLRALTTGDAEIALAGSPAVVLAAQSNNGTRLVGTWFPVNDVYWIAPEKRPLEGATLGVTGAGSTTQMTGAYVAEKLDQNISLVELGGGMGDSWAAAQSGKITAGWAIHPFVTDKVQNEDAEIIVNARDVVGDFPLDLAATSDEFADKCPEALTAFFEQSDKALSFVREDTEAAAEALAPIMKLDPKLIAESIRDTPDVETAYSLKVDKKSLDVLSEMMVFNGAIEKPVNWAELLDQQFLPEDARADL